MSVVPIKFLSLPSRMLARVKAMFVFQHRWVVLRCVAVCASILAAAARGSLSAAEAPAEQSEAAWQQYWDEPAALDDMETGLDPSMQCAGTAMACDCEECDCCQWTSQLLPDGLIYRSYLAGAKEPRLASYWAYEDDQGWIWDITLGGRVGLWRYGTTDDVRPEGWQLDVEGAALPRLDPEQERDLVSADFRAGVPLTYGVGAWQTKVAYYHLSSHLGDEYMLRNVGARRVNYSRDVLVIGQSYYLNDDVRLYGEAGWAFYSDVSEPWEFQFGLDYSPLCNWNFRGSPFAALNVHLRQEVDFSGNFVAQAGWQWRDRHSGHLFRAGLEYFDGKSDQFEFFDQNEKKVGLALWYDY